MDRRDFFKQCGCCLLTCAAASLAPGGVIPGWNDGMAWSQGPRWKKGLLHPEPSPYFEKLDGSAVRCTLCPRGCELADGDRGYCRVRENRGGQLFSLVFGNPCAVNIDPIEKKPFFHVLPTSYSFSLATAGCNFDCKFCQNWEISQASPDDTMNCELPPEKLGGIAQANGCRSVASTYVEPTVFLEYMRAIGMCIREQGILNLMHSNGFVNEQPLTDLCAYLDAACIDLKSYNEAYYQNVTEGELAPVLQTLQSLRRKDKHIELVTLLLPGKNDSEQEIKDLARWVRDLLGPETPLHFTRFYPRYKLKSLPPTPISTLERSRQLAMGEGLHFVYIGNVPGHEGENTYCPGCGTELIKRVGYETEILCLENGNCCKCGRKIPGIWS